MNREEMLTRLIAQAASAGCDLVTKHKKKKEASELGANRALDRLGLADAGAQGDVDELRELLSAWRDAKSSAWKAASDWLVRGVLALLLVGIAMRLGVGEMLR